MIFLVWAKCLHTRSLFPTSSEVLEAYWMSGVTLKSCLSSMWQPWNRLLSERISIHSSPPHGRSAGPICPGIPQVSSAFLACRGLPRSALASVGADANRSIFAPSPDAGRARSSASLGDVSGQPMTGLSFGCRAKLSQRCSAYIRYPQTSDRWLQRAAMEAVIKPASLDNGRTVVLFRTVPEWLDRQPPWGYRPFLLEI